MKLTSCSSSTTAYSKAFKPDELVIAASIYQNELICIAFQTKNGQFRIDLFRIATFEPFRTKSDLSNKPPLMKIGSSLFVSFYPTFLSFENIGETIGSVVVGHGPIDAIRDIHGFSHNANSRKDVSTLCVYRFDPSFGIIQDEKSEFFFSISDGKFYSPPPF